jgi:hypothetical protein
MAKGQAFLSDEEPAKRGPTRHLNVVITEPDEEQNHLVVPITTYRTDSAGRSYRGQDDSCILPPGCHSFIRVKSYVRYANARKMSYTEIFNGISKGLIIRMKDMEARYVQDMQRGAEQSPYLPAEFYHFFAFFIEGAGEMKGRPVAQP